MSSTSTREKSAPGQARGPAPKAKYAYGGTDVEGFSNLDGSNFSGSSKTFLSMCVPGATQNTCQELKLYVVQTP